MGVVRYYGQRHAEIAALKTSFEHISNPSKDENGAKQCSLRVYLPEESLPQHCRKQDDKEDLKTPEALEAVLTKCTSKNGPGLRPCKQEQQQSSNKVWGKLSKQILSAPMLKGKDSKRPHFHTDPALPSMPDQAVQSKNKQGAATCANLPDYKGKPSTSKQPPGPSKKMIRQTALLAKQLTAAKQAIGAINSQGSSSSSTQAICAAAASAASAAQQGAPGLQPMSKLFQNTLQPPQANFQPPRRDTGRATTFNTLPTVQQQDLQGQKLMSESQLMSSGASASPPSVQLAQHAQHPQHSQQQSVPLMEETIKVLHQIIEAQGLESQEGFGMRSEVYQQQPPTFGKRAIAGDMSQQQSSSSMQQKQQGRVFNKGLLQELSVHMKRWNKGSQTPPACNAPPGVFLPPQQDPASRYSRSTMQVRSEGNLPDGFFVEAPDQTYPSSSSTHPAAAVSESSLPLLQGSLESMLQQVQDSHAAMAANQQQQFMDAPVRAQYTQANALSEGSLPTVQQQQHMQPQRQQQLQMQSIPQLQPQQQFQQQQLQHSLAQALEHRYLESWMRPQRHPQANQSQFMDQPLRSQLAQAIEQHGRAPKMVQASEPQFVDAPIRSQKLAQALRSPMPPISANLQNPAHQQWDNRWARGQGQGVMQNLREPTMSNDQMSDWLVPPYQARSAGHLPEMVKDAGHYGASVEQVGPESGQSGSLAAKLAEALRKAPSRSSTAPGQARTEGDLPVYRHSMQNRPWTQAMTPQFHPLMEENSNFNQTQQECQDMVLPESTSSGHPEEHLHGKVSFLPPGLFPPGL